MPSCVSALVPAVVPMVAADGWGRSAVYAVVRGASVLTLPFTSDTDAGLDRADFSLMGDRNGGGRLNGGEDTESTTVAGEEWGVDGSTDPNGGLVD